MTRRDIFFVGNEVNELGGVGRWQIQMARLLAERGHRVKVVGIAPPHAPMELNDPPFETATLYARRPPSRPKPRLKLGRLDPAVRRAEGHMQAAADKLTRMFRAAGPGAVIIVTQVWAMEWVALADTAGHTVIGMSHEAFETSKKSSRFERVKTYYKDVDRLLVLTQEDADRWAVEGMNNVGFMPNPLPLTPTQETSERTEKVVLSVGRLSHEKGIDMLLDAWAEASRQQPGWVLRLHGTGDQEAALKQRCAELGLEDSVDFAGQTDDVPAALRKASVFALSSRGEGFPLALLEAMAFGLPCAAFDCAPGVHEIITDGEDGLLARPGNTTELAERLVRLMSDEELRETMGEKARRSVQRYSPEHITDRWEELFAFLER
ncbi:hypothetical protein SY2F82_03460 [Streptomyces sp. Y2F8-2]|uniref:glycosyltransferase family 4 protein n=1 Tax=Streptomyces sp. Y2F8-2 TaxID=2759675 RepID=UPI0019050A10|nr:glycosyltransferase family 4 protein [Streptomyces sp. Y2F8-2]GHJ98548.1 hypothetical protein SY2F82_03460 [Streptomyces sp. Y2F8-2]